MPRRAIKRDVSALAFVAVLVGVATVLFYYLQVRLTVQLWDSFKLMEAKADEWREAFINKPKW